jgi:hypothetical protein
VQPLEGMTVHYVDLQATAAPQATEAVDAVH